MAKKPDPAPEPTEGETVRDEQLRRSAYYEAGGTVPDERTDEEKISRPVAGVGATKADDEGAKKK